MNRFLELATGSRYRGTGAYVTTAVRVVTGVLFVTFSIGKFSDHMKEAMDFDRYGVPLADVTVYIVGVVELVGGLLLLVGLFTRLAALILAANMVGRDRDRRAGRRRDLPPRRRPRPARGDALPRVGGLGRIRGRRQAHER